jgi:hypothetical protein
VELTNTQLNNTVLEERKINSTKKSNDTEVNNTLFLWESVLLLFRKKYNRMVRHSDKYSDKYIAFKFTWDDRLWCVKPHKFCVEKFSTSNVLRITINKKMHTTKLPRINPLKTCLRSFFKILNGTVKKIIGSNRNGRLLVNSIFA